ncbi:sigma-70 family RNA polymerase sigma factor [Bacillus mangrovi]|uniref:Sigma-70 family RNA polymerase sigma factor n=1 Tax=Metabacillus mangrovi TaxID=1491830 RepID=A0A7X2S8K4_9BACI|nr:RNA polymerase sigma factor [Metabacillus mangrovi]MTH55683.1 sigma-70 family RNA polymerase sigma factor [Metabacillus mangrovi]
MVENNDAQLYERLSSKDRQAFETLYSRYEKLLFSFAYKVTKDRGMAEEVLQDVFVKLWNGTNTFDSSKGKFSSWLLTITRNKAIDMIRKHARHEHYELQDKDALVSGEKPVDKEVEWREDREMIRQAVSELNSDQQKVIDLFYFKGFSQQKISEKCGVPLGTVKGRIRLALKHLKQTMEKGGRSDYEA